MPLPMVHLNIAKLIADAGFVINDMPQFYLGTISPDAIHMRKIVDGLSKNDTHLVPARSKWFTIDENEFFSFLMEYINTNRKKTNMDFLWGYGIHILTDMYWTKYVYSKFVEDYRKDSTPIQEERQAYYNDTDQLDQILFNVCGWKDSVWQKLRIAKGSDFLGLLYAQEIDAWNDRTLHWYDSGESQHKNPLRYIFMQNLEGFIFTYSKKIWGYGINAYRIS